MSQTPRSTSRGLNGENEAENKASSPGLKEVTHINNATSSSLPLEFPWRQTQLPFAPAPGLSDEKAAKRVWCQSQPKASDQISAELDENVRIMQVGPFITRAAIGSVHRVPAEVLGLIFMIHVWENDNSPWLPAHVSRAWRAAALMTKHLWACIFIAPPNWSNLASPRHSLGSREICFQLGQFMRALKRANGAPLDLKIGPTPMRRHSYRDPNGSHELISLVELAQGEQSAKVYVQALEMKSRPVLDRRYLECFTFYNLEVLRVYGSQPDVMEKVVAETRHVLKLNVSATSMHMLKNCVWWETLEDLSIPDSLDFEEAKVVRSVLLRCKALKTLSLNNGMHIWDLLDNKSKIIRLRSLKSLKLHSFSIFLPAECPNITHLELHMPTGARDLTGASILAPRSIRLPYLTELKIITPYYEDTLCVFDVPALHRLVLQGMRGKVVDANLIQNIWPRSTSSFLTSGTLMGGIEPHVFELRYTEIDEELLVHILMERPLLEEFSAVGITITRLFFDVAMSFQQRVDEKKPASLLCFPMLKSLIFDNYSHASKPTGRGEQEDRAKAWLKARTDAGMPLERLAIRYPGEEEWIEFADGI